MCSQCEKYVYNLCCFLQDTVSVHRPGFYADRFEKFMCNVVFKKVPRELNSLFVLNSLFMPADKGLMVI